MNKQLLRLKQRSNGDVLQVSECDDSNNLYVNVADGKLDVGTIDEVTNVSDVDSVNLVDRITLVDKAIAYGSSVEYGDVPLFVSDKGYQYTVEAQEGLQLVSGSVTFPASAAANTVRYVDVTKHPYDNHRTWLLTVRNPTDVALTVKVLNEWTTSGGFDAYAEVKSGTIAASAFTIFPATAWSSCFTSINSVLSDESGDINDTTPPQSDVPFTFGAVNDAIYFGAPIPFRGMNLIVGTPGVYNASGVWEYWNGSAWTTLTVQSVNGTNSATAPFKVAGRYIITFGLNEDWTAYDISGNPTSQYWLRFRVTNFVSMTTGPALSYGYYLGYKESLSKILTIEYAFNNMQDIRILFSNDTQLGAADATVYYELRSV